MVNELTTTDGPATGGPMKGGSTRAMRRKAREEAPAGDALLEFQSPTAALIARPIPVTARMTIWTIFALLVSMLVVGGLFPVDRVVSASGRVVSQSANIVIQPLETAIVRAINVHEGQVVHAGDVLAKLDPTFTNADMGNYEAQVVSLKAEVERLQAEEDGTPYKGDRTPAGQLQLAIYGQRQAELMYRLENYKQKIASLESTVQRALSDVRGYTDRLDVAQTVEAKRRELEKLQVGSQLNTLQAQDQRLEVARGLATARAMVDSGTRDLQAMIGERDSYVQQRRAEMSQQLTEQGRKLAEAREQLNKAKLRSQLVDLRAEQDAIVLSVAQISVGSVMQSGDQFITLVPLDAPLEVEVNISGRDAGFAHVGDQATIKFDTFSYSLYGFARGTVQSISADSFTNPTEDRSKLLRPSQKDDSGLGPVFYRAHVSLDELKLHNLPANFHMTPGMPVTTDIKVGERTILSYLLGRVIPSVSEGMREP